MSNLESNELFGGRHAHGRIACIGCGLSHGDPPFADAPNKSYCRVYRREDGLMKPKEVYFDGAPCEFREPE